VRTITIPARFCGPPTSGNGGYSAGSLAGALLDGLGRSPLDSPVEVTLLAPPPLERPLAVDIATGEGTARLLDGDAVVAVAKLVDGVEIAVPGIVTFAQAERLEPDATAREALAGHPFPSCYVCGPGRHDADAFRLWALRVPGANLFAAPYVPTEVGAQLEHVWGALDCPSSAPMMMTEAPFASPAVLGRITATLDRAPTPGERHVVLAWRIGVDGRKMQSGSAIVEDRTGAVVASALATWVQLRT
jgi:hypothetical protein